VSDTYSQTWQTGRKVVAGEEWVLCTVKLCSLGVGDHVLLAQNRFLPPRKSLLMGDWGSTVGSPGLRRDVRYMGDFLARENLKNPIADSAYLTHKIQ
jgi:hypothetical protein